MKQILLSVLAVAAAACFIAAGRSAAELHQRSNATARAYLWQDPMPSPLPAPRLAEQLVFLEPAQLEEEIAAVKDRTDHAAIPRVLGPKKPRARVIPEPVVAPALVVGGEVKPEDAIRMALRSKRASFEHCYEQELKKQASFSGFIVVALSLSATGRVTDAHVQEGNRRDAVVGACIVGQLRTMKLPPLTSEADLLIPIRLQAREPS